MAKTTIELTQYELKKLLTYDPITGVFMWKTKIRGGVRNDLVAGTLNSDSYKQIMVLRRRYLAHRLAWLYCYGVWPLGCLDHIDRNSLNNKLSNLREASKSQNGFNRGLSTNNTSGFKGVCWNKAEQRWKAKIKVNGVTIHLGTFLEIKEAAAAYKAAEVKYAGRFANFS